MKKRNRKEETKIIVMVREVQGAVEELRSLVEDKE